MQAAPAKFEPQPQKWAHPFEAERPRENYLGLTGFVISILGLVFTCGILSPLGLLISLAGLFARPRGYAIAGVITGLLGSLWIVLIVGALWTATAVTVAAKPAIEQFVRHVGETATNVNSISEAREKIEKFRAEQERLPDGVEGNKLIADCKDASGNVLRYEIEEDGYGIRSAGADGQFDTADDVTDDEVDAYLKALEEAKREHRRNADRRPQAPAPPAVPEIHLPEAP